MAKKVTFRPRARGCATGDRGILTITEPGVQFRKGWLTGGVDPADGSVECGEGTEFPMLVTVEQLSEIMYRVKSGSFTQGEWIGRYDEGGYNEEVHGFSVANESESTVHPTFESPDGDNLCFRGYGFLRGKTEFEWEYGEPLSASADSFFEEETSTPVGSWGYGYSGLVSRNIKDDERGMWYGTNNLSVVLERPFGGSLWDFGGAWRCGLSLDITSSIGSSNSPEINTMHGYFVDVDDGITTDQWDFGFNDLMIRFSGVVAFIDNAGNGSPFDTANELYLGIEFSIIGSGFTAVINQISTSKTPSTGYPASHKTSINFSFELSGGVLVSCPIYADTDTEEPGAIDIIYKATKWWEYSDSTGQPAWDKDTGLPINGGPGG